MTNLDLLTTLQQFNLNLETSFNQTTKQALSNFSKHELEDIRLDLKQLQYNQDYNYFYSSISSGEFNKISKVNDTSNNNQLLVLKLVQELKLNCYLQALSLALKSFSQQHPSQDQKPNQKLNQSLNHKPDNSVNSSDGNETVLTDLAYIEQEFKKFLESYSKFSDFESQPTSVVKQQLSYDQGLLLSLIPQIGLTTVCQLLVTFYNLASALPKCTPQDLLDHLASVINNGNNNELNTNAQSDLLNIKLSLLVLQFLISDQTYYKLPSFNEVHKQFINLQKTQTNINNETKLKPAHIVLVNNEQDCFYYQQENNSFDLTNSPTYQAFLESESLNFSLIPITINFTQLEAVTSVLNHAILTIYQGLLAQLSIKYHCLLNLDITTYNLNLNNRYQFLDLTALQTILSPEKYYQFLQDSQQLIFIPSPGDKQSNSNHKVTDESHIDSHTASHNVSNINSSDFITKSFTSFAVAQTSEFVPVILGQEVNFLSPTGQWLLPINFTSLYQNFYRLQVKIIDKYFNNYKLTNITNCSSNLDKETELVNNSKLDNTNCDSTSLSLSHTTINITKLETDLAICWLQNNLNEWLFSRFIAHYKYISKAETNNYNNFSYLQKVRADINSLVSDSYKRINPNKLGQTLSEQLYQILITNQLSTEKQLFKFNNQLNSNINDNELEIESELLDAYQHFYQQIQLIYSNVFTWHLQQSDYVDRLKSLETIYQLELDPDLMLAHYYSFNIWKQAESSKTLTSTQKRALDTIDKRQQIVILAQKLNLLSQKI